MQRTDVRAGSQHCREGHRPQSPSAHWAAVAHGVKEARDAGSGAQRGDAPEVTSSFTAIRDVVVHGQPRKCNEEHTCRPEHHAVVNRMRLAGLLLARAMTRYSRPNAAGGSTNDLRMLLGIPEISPQAIDAQWVPRGTGRLRVPVGLDERGKPLHMDIKESALGGQGPHGLGVGATGAGNLEPR